jgi:hypothetical protein
MATPIDLTNSIENVYTTSPLLIIGEARLLFIKAWKYKINNISNLNDLRELVNYYATIQDNKPIVIDDLSLLQPNALRVLLKFVEESKTPLILLSSFDNIDSILLSRIKTFIRFEEKIQSSFLNLNDFYNLLMDKDFSDTKNSDKMKFYRDKCPKYIQLEPLIKLSSNKDKILSILSGDL